MSSTDEARAKDLVRRREIPERPLLGHQTIDRLVARKWWRPAGCTARLYKGMSTDDPFEPPPDEAPKKEHRPVGAADRFVRIDNANSNKRSPAGFPGATSGKTPYWVEELSRLKSESTRAKAEKVQRERMAARRKGLPNQVHTPAFGSSPDDPTLDRTPPRIIPEESDAGRMRARPRRSQRRVVSHDEEGIDRTPPVIVPDQGEQPEAPRAEASDPEDLDRRPPVVRRTAKPKKQTRSRRKHATVDADGNPIDRTPPKVKHVVTDHRGEPIRPWRERRKQRGGPLGGDASEGGAHEPERTPPMRRPTPPPEAQPPEVVEAAPPEAVAEAPIDRSPSRSAGGGGLDDLFGGMQEGRAKIGRRKKKTVAAIPDEPVPAETIDRTPPRIDRTPPRIDHSPNAEPGPPEPSEPPPAPEPVAEAPIDRSPSRSAGGGGLDDLFGGMQEGRAKIGRRKKKTVAAIPDEPAPAETIDRTPPRIDRTPPKIDRTPPKIDHSPGAEAGPPEPPEPPPAPEPVAEAPIDRSPSRSAGGGGLDDLFGGMQQGRAKIGRREKKKVAAIPDEPAEAPKETVDRTPPKFKDVDPSKLPK